MYIRDQCSHLHVGRSQLNADTSFFYFLPNFFPFLNETCPCSLCRYSEIFRNVWVRLKNSVQHKFFSHLSHFIPDFLNCFEGGDNLRTVFFWARCYKTFLEWNLENLDFPKNVEVLQIISFFRSASFSIGKRGVKNARISIQIFKAHQIPWQIYHARVFKHKNWSWNGLRLYGPVSLLGQLHYPNLTDSKFSTYLRLCRVFSEIIKTC